MYSYTGRLHCGQVKAAFSSGAGLSAFRLRLGFTAAAQDGRRLASARCRSATWHHGLIADYWALTNLDAPEVDLYAPHLRSPVLDAGCGAARLLAPLRERGFDIDGCDVSADMIERCRQRVPDATLWVSALHDLDPPRHYAIVCCGVFGLGSAREQDMQALQRLHDAS